MMTVSSISPSIRYISDPLFQPPKLPRKSMFIALGKLESAKMFRVIIYSLPLPLQLVQSPSPEIYFPVLCPVLNVIIYIASTCIISALLQVTVKDKILYPTLLYHFIYLFLEQHISIFCQDKTLHCLITPNLHF